MGNGIVFAVQQQMKLDPVTKQLDLRFKSIETAASYGEVRYILSPSAHPFEPELVLGDIHQALSGFSDDDFLLLIGNPVLIGMASTIAAHYNRGKVNFLQWSGKHKKYTKISAQLY